jgi:hypothetical protein
MEDLHQVARHLHAAHAPRYAGALPRLRMLGAHAGRAADARVRSWATRMVEELGSLSKDDWQPHVHTVAEECMRTLAPLPVWACGCVGVL